MNLRHRNADSFQEDILINVINELRKLCFGDALLRAVFFEKLFFLKNGKIQKQIFYIRVGFLF